MSMLEAPLAPTRLLCEYVVNPMGVATDAPRLTWWVSDPRPGAVQAAYEIEAGTTPGSADLWRTGRVESRQTVNVRWAGSTIASGQRVYWRVRTWDGRGQVSPWSEPAEFVRALRTQDEWEAHWIGVDEPEHVVAGPLGYLRREFAAARVRSARLYITARGLYEAHINGRRVGADHRTPGWTDYKQRLCYQTYDVTDHLRDGLNAIGIALGDGWYCGQLPGPVQTRIYGDRPQLLAQLELTLADGRRQLIVTDDQWRATRDGPVRGESFFLGDTIDLRMDLGEWTSPGYDDATWKKVAVSPRDGVALDAYVGATVQAIEELKPVSRWRVPSGNWVFDLGQNMVGVSCVRVSGRAGQKIVVRHGEILNPGDDRTVYYANLRVATSTDTYYLRGGGTETLRPMFSLHGFRYVEVEGADDIGEQDVTGIVYHSAIPVTGHFECSHEKINQLQRNIVWGQRGNFVELPTDCPQRDERLGWTGDAQVFIRTAAFNMDVAAFFERWMADVAQSQLSNGAIPHVVPDILSGGIPDGRGSGSPAWGDALVICPWVVYLAYADKRVLEASYPAIRKYIGYLEKRCKDGAYPAYGFGDWLAIGSTTPHELIGTAYSAYSASLAANIAEILGHADDATAYRAFRDRLKRVFNHEFVTPAGRVSGESQTADLLALAFDMVDGPQREAVIKHLCTDITRRGVLTTGFVGVNLLLPTLTRIGRDDLAYKLLTSERFPSWLFSVKHGATTIWERWDGWTPQKGFQDVGMNSFNHYAYGSCGEWMYARVAGIDWDPGAPGYARVILRPCPGGGITWAKGALDSIHGRIESAWRVEGSVMTLSVRVPPNTTARLEAPGTLDDGGSTRELPAGTHELRITLTTPDA